MTVDFKSTPLEPLALQARVVQCGSLLSTLKLPYCILCFGSPATMQVADTTRRGWRKNGHVRETEVLNQSERNSRGWQNSWVRLAITLFLLLVVIITGIAAFDYRQQWWELMHMYLTHGKG